MGTGFLLAAALVPTRCAPIYPACTFSERLYQRMGRPFGCVLDFCMLPLRRFLTLRVRLIESGNAPTLVGGEPTVK